MDGFSFIKKIKQMRQVVKQLGIFCCATCKVHSVHFEFLACSWACNCWLSELRLLKSTIPLYLSTSSFNRLCSCLKYHGFYYSKIKFDVFLPPCHISYLFIFLQPICVEKKTNSYAKSEGTRSFLKPIFFGLNVEFLNQKVVSGPYSKTTCLAKFSSNFTGLLV